VPGNHDIALFDLWSRLTRPYARYTEAFGANLEPVLLFAGYVGHWRQYHALAAQAW
jgi:hypothetical protein